MALFRPQDQSLSLTPQSPSPTPVPVYPVTILLALHGPPLSPVPLISFTQFSKTEMPDYSLEGVGQCLYQSFISMNSGSSVVYCMSQETTPAPPSSLSSRVHTHLSTQKSSIHLSSTQTSSTSHLVSPFSQSWFLYDKPACGGYTPGFPIDDVHPP